ncbi:MAG: hypothetical protein AAF368_15720, partial [Planctomycetota bacterium]
GPIRQVTNTPIVQPHVSNRKRNSKPFDLEQESSEQEAEEERHADEPVGPPDDDEAGQRLDLRA